MDKQNYCLVSRLHRAFERVLCVTLTNKSHRNMSEVWCNNTNMKTSKDTLMFFLFTKIDKVFIKHEKAKERQKEADKCMQPCTVDL